MTILPGDRKLCLNGCFTVKPISDFGRHPRSPDGLQARCKACENERSQAGRHGITRAQKATLAAQQGGCAVCHRTEPSARGWVVDHDHACCPGERSCGACRRGILCHWCNAALGYASDDPNLLRALADYLESGDRLTGFGATARLPESLTRVAPPSPTYLEDERTNEEPPTSQRILTLRNAHARIPKIGFIALTPDSAS